MLGSGLLYGTLGKIRIRNPASDQTRRIQRLVVWQISATRSYIANVMALRLRPVEGDTADTVGHRVKQIVVVKISRSYDVVLGIVR